MSRNYSYLRVSTQPYIDSLGENWSIISSLGEEWGKICRQKTGKALPVLWNLQTFCCSRREVNLKSHGTRTCGPKHKTRDCVKCHGDGCNDGDEKHKTHTDRDRF